jgi:hypothetical protein
MASGEMTGQRAEPCLSCAGGRFRRCTLESIYEFSGAKAIVEFVSNPSIARGASAVLAVLPVGKVQRPIAVIGRYIPGGGYIGLAQKLGARYFSVPTPVWAKMSPAQQWAANQKFLDRQISDNAIFKLSTSARDAMPGTAFAKEVSYLKNKGYEVSKDGYTMTRRGCNTASTRLC